MGWNFFKKKAEKEPSLEERIDAALRKAKTDTREATKEIEDIKKWAADAIIDVYAEFFPNSNMSYYRKQYAETALADYKGIKEKYATKLESEMVEKCDRIVEGYMNQIKLRESKLKLFKKLEDEYKITKSKLSKAQEQGRRTNELDEHTNRLKNMNEDAKSLSTAMTDSYHLEDIKNDIADKEEYFNQLEQLKHQYSDESDYSNSLAFKDEIDKMIDKM